MKQLAAPPVGSTRLDRAIAAMAPGWALKRHQSRVRLAMSGAHTGARSDRTSMQQWFSSWGSADTDLLPDLDTLRRRSRDLERNAPLAVGAINTVVTNVVGTGLQLRARVDSDLLGLSEAQREEWERQAESAWRLWAKSQECDLGRTLTFDGIQDIALRSTLVNGDTFAVRRFVERAGSPYGLKVQLIEADRVCNPAGKPETAALAAGVENDLNGAPAAYWIADRHPGDWFPGRALQWTRVPAFGDLSGQRNVLHLFRPRRIGDRRGRPYLTPVIEALKQLTRYTDAEIMAAVINSCFAIAMKTEDAGSQGGPLTPSGQYDEKGDPISVTKPGQIIDLGLNESVEAFTPGRPNGAFDPFVEAILRQIGVALELPFEVLIKHFTASYSAARAALLQAWSFFFSYRAWLARSLCQPFYQALLIEEVARGRIAARGFFEDPLLRQAWCGAEWIGPAAGQINESDAVAAAGERVAHGFSTIDAETAELTGRDWERNHKQRAREHALRVAAGLEPAIGASAPATPAPLPPAPRPPALPPVPPKDDRPEEREAA